MQGSGLKTSSGHHHEQEVIVKKEHSAIRLANETL